MKQWYVVYTKPRQEAVAEENLERQSYDVYLPRIAQSRRHRGRWRRCIEPLFPRYLFVRLGIGCNHTSPIRYTTGVSNLVRFGDELGVVDDQIVESLRRRADGATGLHLPKDPVFTKGDRVVMDAGPFAGVEAIFQAETGSERVVILLNLLGRNNYISIDGGRLHRA
ncbi:MAG: transcription/translation regulatory transformer protein RfaH [Methylococcales bacterium]